MMTTIIGRVKAYEVGNVIVSVPGQKDKIAFIEAGSRKSTQDNFPPGTEVKVTLGIEKATKGTMICIGPLTPIEITSLAKKELTVLRNEVPEQPPYTADEYKSFLPTEEQPDPEHAAFNASALPAKKAGRI